MTVTASGFSTAADSAAAGAQAIGAARAGLDGVAPRLAFVFAGPDHDLGAVLRAASAEAGGAAVAGCTTAGELTEAGLLHGGVTALVVGGISFEQHKTFATGMKDGPDAVAAQLGEGFEAARHAAAGRRRLHPTTVLLTDGLSGAGEHAVDALRDHTGAFQQIAGGAAGDEGRFQATSVGTSRTVATDAAVAVHVFDESPWGVGVGHGLRPSGRPMHVTRSSGHVVHEIDGQPAVEAYRRHAAERGVALDDSNIGRYMIGNELGVYVFGHLARARAPLAVGADGSLACAAGIEQGSRVCILDGEPTSMLEAARHAAEEAKAGLGGRPAAGILLFDCICRGMILDHRFKEEIDVVRGVFGDVPVAGFLTYGEIARYKGKLDGWHNATAVVLAIPA